MSPQGFMGLYDRAVAEESERRGKSMSRGSEDAQFPFEGWARDHAYPYRKEWLPVLRRCGSAAEVYFLRPFLERGGLVVHDDGSATAAPLTVRLQHAVKGYSVDVLVESPGFKLAIEVDGMAFHHRSKEKVAADYLRQRRIVARGYTVIRFTAAEAFDNAPECWRQIGAIFAARNP